MNNLRKHSLIVTDLLAVAVAGALGLIAARPALASGGWGFGMAYSPSVVASCTSYNIVPVKVDIPEGASTGYITGRLTNTRTGAVRKPALGVETVYNTGSPTLGYLVFNPPEGTLNGDVLHVSLTLSASPALTPTVGGIEFSYRCSTSEVVHTAGYSGGPINTGYGDSLVVLAQGKDSLGGPDVEVWCLDPQGYARTVAMTLSKGTLADLPAYPTANTLIDKNNSCSVPVSAYILTTGEYQVTIGPDPHGVVNQTVFTGLPPSNVHSIQLNVNQQ